MSDPSLSTSRPWDPSEARNPLANARTGTKRMASDRRDAYGDPNSRSRIGWVWYLSDLGNTTPERVQVMSSTGENTPVAINGMAHVILTVSQFDLARAFYGKLLPQLGMKPVFEGDKFSYWVGARTAIGIEPCDPEFAGERFVQERVGLHHLCLRARSRDDVDRCAARLKEMDAKIVRGPMEGSWAPGYYYVLFEDPDGIRLEVNFVPGAGLLAEGSQFKSEAGYI